jgi:hypothetical protein
MKTELKVKFGRLLGYCTLEVDGHMDSLQSLTFWTMVQGQTILTLVLITR